MTSVDCNIALVGMPGCGKSTIGVLLAKATLRDFIDVDVVIQRREGATLWQILQRGGNEALREAEQAALLALPQRSCVIATGGSAVFSKRGMAQLQRNAVTVFLDVPLAELERRLGDLNARGVLREPGQSLSDVFSERQPLYSAVADHCIACGGRSQSEVLGLIRQALQI